MGFKSKLRPSAEFSSSSIADIVFLLLIFFLLTSQFVTQSAVHVDLPKSDSKKHAKEGPSVTIAADGTYHWKGKEIGEGESRQLKEELIVSKIEEYLVDSTNLDRTINLQGDTAVTYGTIAMIVAAISKHGGAVALQTRD